MKNGFTLLELVVVVLVVGVLAAVGSSVYKDYVLKARFVEAYTILNVITKSEVAYLNENRQFINLSQIPLGSNRGAPKTLSNINGMQTSDWNKVGFPTSMNDPLYFIYGAAAGKTDASGTLMSFDSTTFRYDLLTAELPMYDVNGDVDSPDGYCNLPSSPPATFASIGIVPVPNYDFAVIYASANFSPPTPGTCTHLYRIIDAVNGKFKTSGTVILNYGE